MKFEIVTLFPDYFAQPLRQSLLGKAIDNKLFEIEIINLRAFAEDRHHTVDDRPFGGGGGMVLMIEPIDRCLQKLGYPRRSDGPIDNGSRIVLTSAAGETFGQPKAIEYSLGERLTIICGHYLGVDDRLIQLYDIDEVSLGDFILSGGEPVAMSLIDAIARLIPGVMGNFESAMDDSHMEGLLGAPCYTRPAEYEGLAVPEVLLSGDHKAIEQFRQRQAIEKSKEVRPDLLKAGDQDEEEDE
ncbi:MAG: tRNA (guanosine(37)-N1)-methyltransferase TrmD [candidate division Zixibacteria bacterium]|nr:tRNA (guanosine(37)-N1)-methyltransferase TrmD [candidate division Zixibacteria bacterium]MDH3937368.1 tRNA (guanosine(37)-N1)-methyltransferase TrmD [candidate division Zixibacteria bacterium]